MTEHVRILCVDDDLNVVSALVKMLRTHGFSVNAVGAPQQALKMLEDVEFDILLTDYSMPEMTGVELAQQVKKTHPSLPVILLTGNNLKQTDFATTDDNIDLFTEAMLDLGIKSGDC